MATVKVNINGIHELDFPSGVSSATTVDGVTTINLSGGGGGGVSGSGTTGFVPMWTGATVLGDSHVDDGVSTSGVITASEPLVGTGGAWFGVNGDPTIYTNYNFAVNGVVISAVNPNTAYINVYGVAPTSPPPAIAWGAAILGGTSDGTSSPSGTVVGLSGLNSNFNEIPTVLGNEAQIYIQPSTSSDYPSANSYVGIGGNVAPACQLDVIGDIGINGNIAVPSKVTGYHGSGAGDVKVQLSDGTGTSGHVAAFDATGGLTDGGVPSGSGTVTSVALTVPARQTVTGSPVTTSGTLAISDNTQSANLVFGGPSSGSAAAPTFRSIVAADLPVATSSALGAVQPDGTIITVSSGAVTVAKASSSAFGVVEVDNTTIVASGGVISAISSGVASPSVTFSIAKGTVASPAAPYVLAPTSGKVSHAYFTTLASDGSTNLVFNLKFNGTNIISGTNATVTAGTSAGTVSTFNLTSGTISIVAGQVWELDITTGTSSWEGTVQCY